MSDIKPVDANAILTKEREKMHTMFDRLIPEYKAHMSVDDENFIFVHGLRSYIQAKHCYDYLRSVLKNAPEIETVKHGHWIVQNVPSLQGYVKVICSSCREHTQFYEDESEEIHKALNRRYCDMCGAKMEDMFFKYDTVRCL